MHEAKRVAWQILSLYLVSIGSILIVLFGIWYAKLIEDLISEYSIKLRQEHRFVILQMEKSRFEPIEKSAKKIAQISNIKFAIFDRTKVYFSNLDLPAQTTFFKSNNANIYNNNTLIYVADINLNSLLLADNQNQSALEILGDVNRLRVLIQGDDISKELGFIRFKVALAMVLSLIFVSLVGYLILKFALKPLEARIRFLNNFIKDTTHEINTPISAILMSVESLERKKNFEEIKALKRVKIAALTLSHLYSDLTFLNFSQAYEAKKDWIFLKNLIKERMEYFKIFLEQKNIDLELVLEDNGKIYANKEQFFKMFDNLVNNAIKYNIKNGHIKIALLEQKLIIADSGCGIAKENLANIFERYSRFNENQGGFGIGLSLVDKICKEHNIKIKVESELKKGTKFILTWKN
ncbi:HAMP domain-containing histidine kinase [Campylobacter sp. IFREMER_LSEM_CL1846]|uniref:sensor histidine kinase n=1 Tax=unclassified Campylobacter TaxID=2593542 RepID=UPI00127AD3B0|nr:MULTISPECIES: HAMP domain-containing sensor histidine kinase [unclassified Campylobacter]EAJ5678770.1 HAMP domain-containing histidine kinase [Campylobacter lari]EAK0445272.1 HAMP domain-containing histidine kinase [Campylobacter lari]EAK9943643.1 HAMP domain-containing histidine kinase [Campylobacter lari]MCV3425579.1 HAMP domain-containing histidine kinase [Campylobacter sp. IFREMER_LSEM_CL1085]MCV3434924.1 HAMP domain-containing histidine kinase [Campylobacter sp. IFREMER_LSEM_CL1846]